MSHLTPFLDFVHRPVFKNTKTESQPFRGRLYFHQVKWVVEVLTKLNLIGSVLLNMTQMSKNGMVPVYHI
jgi:hypothetical protein